MSDSEMPTRRVTREADDTPLSVAVSDLVLMVATDFDLSPANARRILSRSLYSAALRNDISAQVAFELGE